MTEKELEKLKQDHLAGKHNVEGYFNEDCILCVNRKNGLNQKNDAIAVQIEDSIETGEKVG